VEAGRNQTFEEALAIDKATVDMLNKNGIPYHLVTNDSKAVNRILNIVETHENNNRTRIC
jgi:ribonucleotide monophosphatase NagD (HAD superfamily)